MSSEWLKFPQMWANCGQIGFRMLGVGRSDNRPDQRLGSVQCPSGAVPKRSAQRGVWKERAARTEPCPTAILSPSEQSAPQKSAGVIESLARTASASLALGHRTSYRPRLLGLHSSHSMNPDLSCSTYDPGG